MKLIIVVIILAIAAWLGSFAGHVFDAKCKQASANRLAQIEEAQP